LYFVTKVVGVFVRFRAPLHSEMYESFTSKGTPVWNC
jgi:hypothetical protein